MMRLIRPAAVAIVLALTLTSVGCGSSGSLSIRSANESGDVLTGNFTTAIYSFNNHNILDVLLIEGPVDNPTQAVHLRMDWRPVAGKTPVDRRSTNATVRYVVFTGEQAGVYAGAGFLFPRSKPGKGLFKATLRSTSMRLADATDDFSDRLGRAIATGTFTATRDEVATAIKLKQIEQLLAKRLGYPRFIKADSTGNLALAD